MAKKFLFVSDDSTTRLQAGHSLYLKLQGPQSYDMLALLKQNTTLLEDKQHILTVSCAAFSFFYSVGMFL